MMPITLGQFGLVGTFFSSSSINTSATASLAHAGRLVVTTHHADLWTVNSTPFKLAKTEEAENFAAILEWLKVVFILQGT